MECNAMKRLLISHLTCAVQALTPMIRDTRRKHIHSMHQLGHAPSLRDSAVLPNAKIGGMQQAEQGNACC